MSYFVANVASTGVSTARLSIPSGGVFRATPTLENGDQLVFRKNVGAPSEYSGINGITYTNTSNAIRFQFDRLASTEEYRQLIGVSDGTNDSDLALLNAEL